MYKQKNLLVEKNKVVPFEEAGGIRAFIDIAFRSDNDDLILIGWFHARNSYVNGMSVLYSAGGDSINKDMYACRLVNDDVENIQSFDINRPDVVHALDVDEQHVDDVHGFLLVIPGFPSEGQLALSLHDGRFASLPFVVLNNLDQIRHGLKRCWVHSGAALTAVLKTTLAEDSLLLQLVVSLDDEHQSKAVQKLKRFDKSTGDSVKFHVECACSLNNALLLVGWADIGESSNVRLRVSDDKGRQHAAMFRNGTEGVRLVRTLRPDLRYALPCASEAGSQQGFVLYWPLDVRGAKTVTVGFDKGAGEPQDVRIVQSDQEIMASLVPLWIHSGTALKTIAAELDDEAHLASLLDEVEAETLSSVSPLFASCDHVIVLNNRVLILNGWIARSAGETVQIAVSPDSVLGNGVLQVTRYPRPDLFPAYPWSREESFGFLAMADGVSLGCDIRVKITCGTGQTQIIWPQVQVMDWAALKIFLDAHFPLAEPLLQQLAFAKSLDGHPGELQARIAWLRQSSFVTHYPNLPTMVENPETVLAAIDRAYALGEAGLLLFGWYLTPKRQPASVSVCSADGQEVDILGKMVPLLRRDVVQAYRASHPQGNDWCGFVCLAPLPTRPGEARALRFGFGDQGAVFLKIPIDNPKLSGIELTRDILGKIPSPELMQHAMYELFNSGLGQAIEVVNRTRPPFAGSIEEQQFGCVGEASVSVIVPLYGRFDFMRHQLAHFVDDPDFRSVDLIYVVDDPSILAATLELAAKYHPLFECPFRVVWYGQNRGFAGANNIGARVARADYLLLLNSDVIPQQAGWLTTLRTSLESLPEAGAIGPLLLFGDGSVQHAGMHPRHDLRLPGFLQNTHPGMGMEWSGSSQPSEQPMLTAACLMLRKADYLALGGLDEGYLVGDFEDSDLCMALRKQGKRLWLEPKARLWHLERQSQNSDNLGQRQLMTLFNGWRYNEKIRHGIIADPTQVEVPQQ